MRHDNVIALDTRRRTTGNVVSLLDVRHEIAAHTMRARRLIGIDELIVELLRSRDERDLAQRLDVDEETVRLRLLTMTPDEHAALDAVEVLGA